MTRLFDLPHHPAADLFPMLTDTELAELADDIETNGLHEPVWLYDDPELGRCVLDGRNRLAACQRVDIDPATRTYDGDDPIGFSVSRNVHRRHLTAGQRAAVAVEALPLYEAEAAKRVGGRPKADEKPRADRPAVTEPRARDKAAKSSGASGRSVARFKRVAEQAPDLAAKVKSGSMALDRAERVIRDREAEARRIEQAQAEAEQQPEPTLVDVRHGDFRETLADLSDVDAIITDPPYPYEFLPLLADLATFADKVLKPDGVLAVLIGQSYLPEVYRLLDGGREYRWTAAYLTPGRGYRSYPRRLQSNWKPLLVYGGGPRFSDTITTEGQDADAKANHKWGQDFAAFYTIVERLTEPGHTVVDPFMGAGTTLLAAHALGRHAIGCDTDADSVTRTRDRLKAPSHQRKESA